MARRYEIAGTKLHVYGEVEWRLVKEYAKKAGVQILSDDPIAVTETPRHGIVRTYPVRLVGAL